MEQVRLDLEIAREVELKRLEKAKKEEEIAN